MRKSMGWILFVLVSAALIAGAWAPGAIPAARAQTGCGDSPPSRLAVGTRGQVTFTDGQPLNVRSAPGLGNPRIGQLPEGTGFDVLEGPVCADGLAWWRVQVGATAGWVAEGQGSTYFVEPLGAAPTPAPGAPAPTPVPWSPAGGGAPFAAWDWAAFVGEGWGAQYRDPLTITPPPGYLGDLPALPVDLSAVEFLDDAGLNDAQRALLAQNGFVVVPGGFEQFYPIYQDDEVWWTFPDGYDWEVDPATQPYGHAYFVTTDAMLHALHYIFDNLLTDLELISFYPVITNDVMVPALQAAHAQTLATAGTPLEASARNAELFLAVALELFAPGQAAALVSPDLLSEAQALTALALAAEGQQPVPFLSGYLEDFSQYRPRGHYTKDPLLEQYFRGMMWISRITFRANDDAETQIALMLLRALRSAPAALQGWTTLHETLSFLVGPVDDLGPPEYSPLVDAFFGANMPLEALADPAQRAGFAEQVAQLPGPRINGLIVPDDTQAGEMAEKTRGFRFLGQRFTFDGYVMQQLIYPYVGTRESPRLLPLGLDVPAAVSGSEVAYRLVIEAGAGDFANYDAQVLKMASEAGALGDAQWLENVYGGWLWALRPLWDRSPASYPPLMNTEAWLRKDLQTGLGSWTELKHDTVLYSKQPTGFGGGGPPLTSFGYVEPNPLVFARIAVVAALTYQGIAERGLDQAALMGADIPRAPGYLAPATRQEAGLGLQTTLYELRGLAFNAANLAEIARKELAGEPLSEDDYWSIFGFGNYLQILLLTLWQGEGPPDPVALVTDVASNPSARIVLQEAVGGVDLIYVVVPGPRGGWQLVRGGVFSYYEWVGNIDQRMTDEEWRAQVQSGDLPPRPAWVSAFYSE